MLVELIKFPKAQNSTVFFKEVFIVTNNRNTLSNTTQ